MRRNNKKKKATSLFVLVENAHNSVANYFPSHFIALHFHTYPPVFLARALSLFVPASLDSPPSHVSPCLRLRPLYTLFSKITFIINLRHQRFINHLSYNGRSVSWSMIRKYHFSETCDGELLTAQCNCVPPTFVWTNEQQIQIWRYIIINRQHIQISW
jgi:hypothetical protein